MSQLFGRVAAVEIIDATSGQLIRIENLRIKFNILKDAARTMNYGDIQIYNLSETTRSNIKAFRDIIRVYAGYATEGAPVRIFAAVITEVHTQRTGADLITYMDCKDGYEALRGAITSRTFAPGYSAISALKLILTDMNLPILFIAPVADKPFLTGWQYSGPSWKALNSIASRLGLEFCIQDQAVKLVQFGTISGNPLAAPLITPSTGLIKTTEKNAMLKDSGKTKITDKNELRQDERHGWKFSCLLNPFLQPMDAVVLQDVNIPQATAFRLERVKHVGDTHDADWQSECITSEKALT